MAKISPLQMTDASSWKGLTTENHLGAIWRQDPQRGSDMITRIQATNFGNNIDTLLSKFPTKEFENDTDFVWELSSKAVNNLPIVEARINGVAVTPADQPGKNYTTFELVFGKNWFSDTQRIVGEKNEIYPVLIVGEPVQEGTNWVYTCRMDTGDANDFIPYEEVVAGKKFSGEYAPVERTMSSKGRDINFKSNITMRNSFSQIRIQKKTPGNMKQRNMATAIQDARSGKIFKMWQQYESFIFDNEFRQDINRLLMFGTSNRSADGSYKIKGASGYEVVEGSGIRQQMESSNSSFYTNFTIQDLSDRLLDLSEGKIPTDQREFVMRTGERGANQFHLALENFTQLFTPLRNETRMFSVSQSGIKMGLGYGGQFIEYMGPNGIKVNLSIDSMYDDRDRNKLLLATGGVAESYRYDIFDIGTTDGEPNIQKVGVKGQPIVHAYIAGLRNPFDPDGAMTAAASAVDAWEEHKMYIGGAIVRDPSKTASFIPNVLA